MIYLFIVNMIGFCCMGIDKYKAIHHCYRIPEKVLLIISIIGGSVGVYCGMQCFHHKTKHPQFSIGIPTMICIQLIIGYYFYR